MLVYWRCVASLRITEDDTLPESTGSSPSHRLSDGAEPTSSVSTVQPARSDASGFPNGAPPRTNARSVFPPKRIELDKLWFVKPLNLNGKQNCQPIPMAFAPDGPVMMPSEPSLRRFGIDRNMRSKSTSPAASILHVDASFKNPSGMSEEQHRSLPRRRERTAYRHIIYESFRMLLGS